MVWATEEEEGFYKFLPANTDREPEDYKAYDLTKDDQILEAFEGCVGQEPHSAWKMYKEDEAW
ncbi:TPA: hypothetical protein ACH3X1_015268 [Trebouxia sp. C0004]